MTKQERMAVEKLLKCFREMKRDTALLGLRLDVMREKLMAPTNALIRFDGDDESVKKLHERAVALEKELYIKAQKLAAAYEKIEAMIDMLESGKPKSAFYARYVCGDSWIKIQHKIECSDRHARRFAYKGLEQFAELFGKDEREVR